MCRVPLYLVTTTLVTLAACGGPSRTISETTTAFPTCDAAQGTITVDELRCGRAPCADDKDSLSGRAQSYVDRYAGGTAAQHYARAKGVEGNTLAGLRGAHRKLTDMLVNALRETGCFASVERYAWEKNPESDWRIGGNVDKIFASTDGVVPAAYGPHSATRRTKQDARAEVTVNIQKGESFSVIDQRQFHVTARRVGTLKVATEHYDWSRQRDEVGFGDTAMQDVANEIVTEAAVFVTEKLAGSRIIRRVALSGLKSAEESPNADKDLTAP